MHLNIRNILVGMFVGFVTLLLVFGVFIFSYLSQFSKASQLSYQDISTILRDGFAKRKTFSEKNVTFLFLGLDKRDDEFEKTLLTDSIVVTSLNTITGTVTTISLPRDLWIPDLQTKINALYFYGNEQEDSSGMEFATKEIGKITGVTPDFTVVLHYTELPKLIDIVGGIDVAIERTFVDTKYPNPDYIEGSLGVPPYTTVRFDQGIEHMDGARALFYVRSRGSVDPNEGSDIARSRRQMVVLQSVIEKVKSKHVAQDPQTMGMLYRFWHDDIEKNMGDTDAVGLGLTLRNIPLSINPVPLPVVQTEHSPALLIHPPISKYGLWVYEPKDPTWGDIQKFFAEKL